MSIPKAVVRHTRITFTALYCSKVMYSVGCYVYSSHYRLKKSDKRYFFALQPSAYMSFNKSVMLVSLFPLSLLNPYKSLIYSCFNCLEFFDKRTLWCSSYSLLNHCLIIIQTIQRIGDFCFIGVRYVQINCCCFYIGMSHKFLYGS